MCVSHSRRKTPRMLDKHVLEIKIVRLELQQLNLDYVSPFIGWNHRENPSEERINHYNFDWIVSSQYLSIGQSRHCSTRKKTWRRQDMETLSALLAFSINHRWIPSYRACNAQHWCFLCCQPDKKENINALLYWREQADEITIELSMTWDPMPLMWRRCIWCKWRVTQSRTRGALNAEIPSVYVQRFETVKQSWLLSGLGIQIRTEDGKSWDCDAV